MGHTQLQLVDHAIVPSLLGTASVADEDAQVMCHELLWQPATSSCSNIESNSQELDNFLRTDQLFNGF